LLICLQGKLKWYVNLWIGLSDKCKDWNLNPCTRRKNKMNIIF
jgi:hypothetical protein